MNKHLNENTGKMQKALTDPGEKQNENESGNFFILESKKNDRTGSNDIEWKKYGISFDNDYDFVGNA